MRSTSVTSTNSDKNSKISFKMPNERGKKLPLVNMG